MKTKLFFLVGFLFLFFSATSQIKSKSFNRKSTASIARIALFGKGDSIAPNILWSQFDATKRSTLTAILPQKEGSVRIRVLAENTPDAAIETISKITNSINFKNLDVSSVAEIARSIAQIKRSSAVENFRTISYRISELIGNDGKIDPDVKTLIQDLIKAATETSVADNNLALEETRTSIAEYHLKLEKEKIKAEVIQVLKSELRETVDADRKKAIIKKLEEMVQ